MACCVCAKILGIGAAENSWHDMNLLKSGNCGHLQEDSLVVQTTIYGQDCMEEAWHLAEEAPDEAQTLRNTFTTIKESDYKAQTLAKPKKKRVFKAYKENWKRHLVRDCRAASDAHFLKNIKIPPGTISTSTNT